MSENKKKDITKPDPLQSAANRALPWIEENKNRILILIFAFLIAGAGLTAFNVYEESKEKELQTKYFELENTLSKIQENIQKRQTEKEDKKLEEVNFEKEYGVISQKITQFIEENPDSKAGIRASLLLSSLYAEFEKETESLPIFEKLYKSNAKKKNLLSQLLKIRYGASLEKNKNCDKAIQVWDEVLAQKEYEFLHPEANLKKALCYESLDKQEEAEKLYQKIKEDHANTSIGREAEKYLRLLTLGV